MKKVEEDAKLKGVKGDVARRRLQTNGRCRCPAGGIPRALGDDETEGDELPCAEAQEGD